MTVLNLAVADQLNKFASAVEKEIEAGMERRLAIIKILREYIKTSKPVRFEGDGYSEDWIKEAAARNLPNVKDTPRALKAYLEKKSKVLFSKYKVCSERELEARHEILLENYILKIQIESRIMGDLALNHIIPTAVAYQNKLITNAKGLKELGIEHAAVITSIKEISQHLEEVKVGVYEMIEERKRINKIENVEEKALAYCDDIKEKYFHRIRYAVDKLELYVDSEEWPLPKYRELLFLR